jgi:hypothetical protein
MRRSLPSEQAFSDPISAISKRGPHVPGPPGKVVKQQARSAVPSEPLPADSVSREALKCVVPERYNANRHPGNSDQQGWKRQGAGRNEQGKRQTDLKCRTRFHSQLSPSSELTSLLAYSTVRKGKDPLDHAAGCIQFFGQMVLVECARTGSKFSRSEPRSLEVRIRPRQ